MVQCIEHHMMKRFQQSWSLLSVTILGYFCPCNRKWACSFRLFQPNLQTGCCYLAQTTGCDSQPIPLW